MVKSYLFWTLALLTGFVLAGDDLTRIGNRTIERVRLCRAHPRNSQRQWDQPRLETPWVREVKGVDERLTDCATANTFIIRSVRRSGSAKQVVGLWRRCLCCTLLPRKYLPLHLELNTFCLEHRKAHPADP